MSSTTLKRWLLVNYAGYPFAPNSLMPDNGLANLAGSLLQSGRQVRIMDYCTLGILESFAPEELSAPLSRAWDRLAAPSGGGTAQLNRIAALLSLHRCDRRRRVVQDRVADRIAEELIADIRRNAVQALGFKLWNGDGLRGVIRMAAAVRREFPRIRIFGGGPQVDVFMEHLLTGLKDFDALVYGEGEETILQLAESEGMPASYGGIPNLLYLDGSRPQRTDASIVADLDALPMPAYSREVYPAMAGNEKIKIVVIDESRGCRNNCAFCSHPIKSSRNLRTKSISRLVEEVDRLDRDFGIRAVRFAGSCTPYDLLNNFAAEIVNSGRMISYASFAHIRDAKEADFGLLRRSGCLSLFFGIESGNQDVLNKMRKGIRSREIPGVIGRARRAGIFTVGSLIYPAPGDTAETALETLALMAEEPPDAVTIQAPIVTPRTDWFDRPERYGIRFSRGRDHYLREALKWKLSLLLPPAFWGNLPVAIDGRSYKQVLRETTRFVKQARQAGLTTSFSDDMFLMSVLAGMSVPEFRDKSSAAFFAGDIAAVRELVRSINAGRVGKVNGSAGADRS